jgi:hypothetical protein
MAIVKASVSIDASSDPRRTEASGTAGTTQAAAQAVGADPHRAAC